MEFAELATNRSVKFSGHSRFCFLSKKLSFFRIAVPPLAPLERALMNCITHPITFYVISNVHLNLILTVIFYLFHRLFSTQCTNISHDSTWYARTISSDFLVPGFIHIHLKKHNFWPWQLIRMKRSVQLCHLSNRTNVKTVGGSFTHFLTQPVTQSLACSRPLG